MNVPVLLVELEYAGVVAEELDNLAEDSCNGVELNGAEED